MPQIFYFLGHEQFQPELLVKHAQLAEQAGFDGVFVSEHFNPWVADKGSAGFALSTLGAIAITTTRIQLMTGVITPLYRYHPALIAQAAATIDRLSKGRFMLGVGTGESINEAPLGYIYPKYKERSARMKEAIEIMKRLLAGEKVTFTGEYYKTDQAKLYSPPVKHVPILLAAGGAKSAELAGEVADGLVISVKNPEETMKNIVKPALDKAKVKNKNLLITASRWTVFAQNDDEAWGALQAWRGLRAPSRDTAGDPELLQKEADELPRNEILSRYSIVNSADEYIATYTPLIQAIKADIVVIQTTGVDQEKVIDLLGKEVIPHLKKL